MKITQITRTISGNNYDNISATAVIEEGDDVNECIVKLDDRLKNALDVIEHKIPEQKSETTKAISILEEALLAAKKRLDEIPF